jgi:hypothetical protein
VAIRREFTGLVVLYAFWYADLRMFLRDGLVAEWGLPLVVQNVSGSIFNSHLFDFAEGWLYVLCVGVAGRLSRSSFRGRCWQPRSGQSGPLNDVVCAIWRGRVYIGNREMNEALSVADSG